MTFRDELRHEYDLNGKTPRSYEEMASADKQTPPGTLSQRNPAAEFIEGGHMCYTVLHGEVS